MKMLSGFYANLTTNFDDPDTPALGQAYVRGQVIAFSPANIVDFLSFPHHAQIEGTEWIVILILMGVAKVHKDNDDAQ